MHFYSGLQYFITLFAFYSGLQYFITILTFFSNKFQQDNCYLWGVGNVPVFQYLLCITQSGRRRNCDAGAAIAVPASISGHCNCDAGVAIAMPAQI